MEWQNTANTLNARQDPDQCWPEVCQLKESWSWIGLAGNLRKQPLNGRNTTGASTGPNNINIIGMHRSPSKKSAKLMTINSAHTATIKNIGKRIPDG